MSAIEREVLARATSGASGLPAQADAAQLKTYYRQMLAIRRMEEAPAKAYSQGKIGGFLHLYIGQEAVGVGAIAALEPEDYVVTTYREHGHALAKGMSARADPGRALRQEDRLLEGPRRLDAPVRREHELPRRLRHRRRPHPARGRRRVRVEVPRRRPRHAVLLRRGRVDASAASTRAVALAALWKLPIVFICENNEYSMGTPLSRSMSVEDVSLKALAYGMARDRFDGDDVLEVERAHRRGRARARATESSRRSSRSSPTASAATR